MLKELESQGEKIIWCDGTNKYRHPLEALRFREELKKSKGLTKKNIQKTTAWLMKRHGAGAKT
jgi:hypothetical protein